MDDDISKAEHNQRPFHIITPFHSLFFMEEEENFRIIMLFAFVRTHFQGKAS